MFAPPPWRGTISPGCIARHTTCEDHLSRFFVRYARSRYITQTINFQVYTAQRTHRFLKLRRKLQVTSGSLLLCENYKVPIGKKENAISDTVHTVHCGKRCAHTVCQFIESCRKVRYLDTLFHMLHIAGSLIYESENNWLPFVSIDGHWSFYK
jgi:hypothetical protein